MYRILVSYSMSARLLVSILVVMGIFFGGYIVYVSSPEKKSINAINDTKLENIISTDPPDIVQSSVGGSTTLERGGLGEHSVNKAIKRYEAALAKRIASEKQFEKIELAVIGLEQYVDSIEQRGDNPVDFQDENLGKFQKIFAEYQDAEINFEAAKKEETASLKLLELEQAKIK